jgi:hypothetical protein
MAQVSNVQSHTLRLLGSLSDDVKKTLQALDGCVVLEKVSNDSPKTFVSAPDVTKVIEVLNSNNLLFRPHFYSLFVKFNTELKVSEVSKLNAQVLALVPTANVSYSRVDENGHTGKVVVDRFDDYNTLRASTGDVTFFKFNRTKAQARVGTAGTSSNAGNNEGWKTVNNRSPRTGDNSARTPRAPRQEGDNNYRTARAPRQEGDNNYRTPRTPRQEGDNNYRTARAPRQDGPRTPRQEGDNNYRTPRAPRQEGDNAYVNSRPQRFQGGERKQSDPKSWAGRAKSSVVAGTPSSSTPAPTTSAPASS